MQNSEIPVYFITGAPGSGKGTQAHLLQDRLGFLHVSSGDVFRNAIERKDSAAMMAKDLMVRGELVPDDLIETMVHDELAVLIKQHPDARGVILDGFPRTLEQAEMVEDMLKDLPVNFRGMINLHVPQQNVVDRLRRRAEIEHRPDDTEDVILERLRIWQEKTKPLERYYSERNQLITVDGEGHTEEVYSRLVPILLDNNGAN